MPPTANSAPGYERFQPNETALAIQLSDEARERMLSEVMTGFGAVPRRGAEVGGILLGRQEAGAIWVDDVALAACEHRRGPSFLLSDADRRNLEKLVLDLRAAGSQTYPVGMFRSNTRETDAVSDEDRDLFYSFFPPPDGLFMLIRPFATKPSRVSFLLYQGQGLPDSSEMFTLARARPGARTLDRGRVSVPAPAPDAGPSDSERGHAVDPWTSPATTGEAETTPHAEFFETPPSDYDAGSRRPTATGPNRRNWMLVPLSFIFLLLGVLLGFQAALTLNPKPKAADASALSAGLTASRKGENLHIRWNREALAITSAQSGTLEIEDGRNRKSVELDASALQNGSVIYPPVSDHVRLRFEITVRSGTRLIETLSWSKKPE